MMNLSFTAKQSLPKMLFKQVSKYNAEIGILEDGPAAKWKKEPKTLRGVGTVNRIAGNSKKTLREVMTVFNLKYNLLLAPFRNKNNKEVLRVVDDIARDLKKGGNGNRVRNGLQAAVRNPISRKEYGDNSAKWAKAKGFNFLFVNTGRLFRSIKVRFIK